MTTLADLKSVKAAIQERAKLEALAAAQQAQRAQKAQRRAADGNLFANAAGIVQPLPDKRTANIKKAPPEAIPRQQQRDDQAVLLEAISDEFDVSTLLEVDDTLSYRQSGIGTDVTRKLRRGNWSIQAQLDLHGLRTDDARERLGAFIRESSKHGIRCVRIVHGKGLGSPGKAPVLKNKVHGWLIQKKEVLAFVQAKPADGGAGAVVVLLQSF
jgi:DNA-nicking Smr family endonuclease